MSYSILLKNVYFACFAIALSGCSSQPLPVTAALPYSAAMEGASAPVPSLDDIFQLTSDQQAEFMRFFNSDVMQTIPKHKRVYKFLERHLDGFHYLGKNLTASQAFASKSGNCISLAVLTKALANLAGVPAEFQTIVSAPVYSMQNDYMLASDHVRTFLSDPDFSPEKGMIYFVKPTLVVDYLPSAGDVTGPRISQQTFIAMYYRNLAADALLSQQYPQALALLHTALSFDPHFGGVINLAAIVHRRMEQNTLAEQFYQYGLDVSASKATLLGNYAVLKMREGDTEQAEKILQTLKDQNEYDPYLWYVLGRNASQKKQFSDAVIYFEKAATQAPYLHQLQLALAIAYYHNNQPDLASFVLAKAVQLAPEDNTRQRYDLKLQALILSQRSQ